MRAALEKTLRSQLEKTVQKAREIVETAVSEVLARLGVADNSAPSYLSDDERKLRNRLRAHGRQLGDVLSDNGCQSTELLVNEMAYEHWHRMLFARFLEQNHLLMYDPQTPVTLDECTELAADEGFSDGWQLAAKLAEKMLPQIFKTGSPVFDVKLPINHIRALEQLISSLHPDTFQASDSLGWCYQFWQTKKKKEINDSGVKIGAQELSPVTQLFTEPYMVSFLLDNALGAWWAKRRLSADDLTQAPNEQHLRELAAIDGVPLTYLRFVKVGVDGSETGQEQWQPAAGWFDAWPTELKELKTLDPCCGSGHFLVALFLMLVPMRIQLDGLSARAAVDAVLRDNLHGLELDKRCVELAAFAIALEAWRYPESGGYRILPELELACSGIAIHEATRNWKKNTSGGDSFFVALDLMQKTFENAPILGSLLRPELITESTSNTNKYWAEFYELLESKTEEAHESKVVAKGLAKSADLLTKKYTWILTNVPYKTKGDLDKVIQQHLETYYPRSKSALETAFLERCLEMCEHSGSCSIVLPQNMLFLTSYKFLRKHLLSKKTICSLALLGEKAFRTPVDAAPMLISIHNQHNAQEHLFALDVSEGKSLSEKSENLVSRDLVSVDLLEQIKNPDHRIMLETIISCDLLSKYSYSNQGIPTSDNPMFVFNFWEHCAIEDDWEFFQGTVETTCFFAGKANVVRYENGTGKMRLLSAEQTRDRGRDRQGKNAWLKRGIAVNLMGKLSVSIYDGNKFDNNIAVITPVEQKILLPIYAFCSSETFDLSVRAIDKKRNVTNGTLVKVPFDLNHWIEVGSLVYPNGLPNPFTNDVTQWLFHGHPCGSVIWDESIKWTAIAPRRIDDTVLQVAIARLLGYQWPAERDPEMELAEEMRYWLKQNSVFDSLVDDDGIVCIPSVRGEKPAADRLEAILQLAYAEDWSANTLQQLLAAVGSSNLQQYLRDKFFEQHCKIFQNRPFIWQIWDGLKDGFSALVNYHKLDNKGLERLIYTYLGDWIRTQEHGVKEGVDGADIRLTAAKNLETRLKAILEGEKGLDIFVRWKHKYEQPIGWNPDLNDGVRLNIRPFMKAADVGKKGAGVLRIAPKIDWKKDRGTDVPSAPSYQLGPQYGEQEGSRINDHYLTLAEKQAARAEYANKEGKHD